jgi:hypothetical protein
LDTQKSPNTFTKKKSKTLLASASSASLRRFWSDRCRTGPGLKPGARVASLLGRVENRARHVVFPVVAPPHSLIIDRRLRRPLKWSPCTASYLPTPPRGNMKV